MEFIGQVHAGRWGESASRARAPASFRSAGVGLLTAQGAHCLGTPAPTQLPPGAVASPRCSRTRGASLTPFPSRPFAFTRSAVTTPARAPLKGHAIKCSRRQSCKRVTAELPKGGSLRPGARPQSACEGSFPAKRKRPEEGTPLALALGEYPVQILPPTRSRARTCANNALSRL